MIGGAAALETIVDTFYHSVILEYLQVCLMAHESDMRREAIEKEEQELGYAA
jgi:truncated hemoglobin YjbI